jgi:hypothetical protein
MARMQVGVFLLPLALISVMTCLLAGATQAPGRSLSDSAPLGESSATSSVFKLSLLAHWPSALRALFPPRSPFPPDCTHLRRWPSSAAVDRIHVFSGQGSCWQL